MQINNNKGRQKDIPNEQEEYDDDGIKRDLELENIAGNLMIAEYQVNKLKQRLSKQVRGLRYRSFSNMKTSSHTFKYDCKWCKLSIEVEELFLGGSKNNILE
jgi:hypothetical protein